MQRRYDLDWVRVCAFGLLVLYHTGMYYVSWGFHIKSPHAGTALEPLMLLTGPWRMSLLFVVSGVATAFLLGRSERTAPAGIRSSFLGQRSWRLLLPLVFGILVIVPPQSYFEVVEKLPGGYFDGYLAFWKRYLAADGRFCFDGNCLILPTWNHLWFVAYLWVYTVALWLLLRFAPKAMQAARSRLERRLSGAGALLWPTLWLVAVRLALVSRFGSTHALVDDWYNHTQYVPMFLIGFLLAFSNGFWESLQRQRWTALGAAFAAYAVLIGIRYFAGYDDGNPPPDSVLYLLRIVWGINQWCMIVAVFGFAYRLRGTGNAALRYLTLAIFPVYILHQTVLIVLAHGFKPMDLPPLLEGPLLVVLTFAACFAGYELIRRVPLLRPLFGLKYRAD